MNEWNKNCWCCLYIELDGRIWQFISITNNQPTNQPNKQTNRQNSMLIWFILLGPIIKWCLEIWIKSWTYTHTHTNDRDQNIPESLFAVCISGFYFIFLAQHNWTMAIKQHFLIYSDLTLIYISMLNNKCYSQLQFYSNQNKILSLNDKKTSILAIRIVLFSVTYFLVAYYYMVTLQKSRSNDKLQI